MRAPSDGAGRVRGRAGARKRHYLNLPSQSRPLKQLFARPSQVRYIFSPQFPRPICQVRERRRGAQQLAVDKGARTFVWTSDCPSECQAQPSVNSKPMKLVGRGSPPMMYSRSTSPAFILSVSPACSAGARGPAGHTDTRMHTQSAARSLRAQATPRVHQEGPGAAHCGALRRTAAHFSSAQRRIARARGVAHR